METICLECGSPVLLTAVDEDDSAGQGLPPEDLQAAIAALSPELRRRAESFCQMASVSEA